MNWKRLAFAICVGLAGFAVGTILVPKVRQWRPRSITIQGAVLRRDSDTRRELPIANAAVTASDGAMSASTQSDASGYFSLVIKAGVWPREVVNLSFRHPDFQPVDLKLQAGLRSAAAKLYVVAMEPAQQPVSTKAARPQSVISNIRVRYTENMKTEENIGSALRIFQAVNKGNVPCDGQLPCSPDGRWKAVTGFVTLSAGAGNEFRNVRASCIAGPCPFTRIDSSTFRQGGRTVTASALDWSDTATFLLEAEVFHTSINSSVRHLYPVVFERNLNFTLPPTEEGVSIEAEVDGQPMVFPLGPDLYLSWATCTERPSQNDEKATIFRCELKPGYSFH